ncbi:MAG: RNA polymerase sigma factor [Ktedonobacteraceae bacterium]
MQMHWIANQRSSDLTDDFLIQQAQSGNPDAFAMLVERYNALLFRLITQLVRDEHLAQDVLQHVFIQLYRSLPILRSGVTIKSWLCQVARHRCIDELRRKRPLFFSEIGESPDEEEISLLTSIPDTARQPEEQFELIELRQRILEAIELLPPNFRMVVRLRYDTQLSYREIGLALSIPEATAKTYFYRARKQLRTFLGPELAYYRG